MAKGGFEVLVGIPTYARPESLGRCLAALASQTFQDYDLFINFDAPPGNCLDASGEFWLAAHRRARSVVTHVSNHEGQVAGHNRALWNAGYNHKYILRLDDDIILNTAALEEAVRCIKSDPKIAAVGGLWFDTRGGQRRQTSLAEFKRGLTLGAIDQHVQSAYFPPEEFDRVVDVPHIYSACLYNADVMRSVGGWAEIFTLHVAHREETEGTIRLKRAGFRLVVDPKVSGQHLWFSSGGVRVGDSAEHTRSRQLDEQRFRQRIAKLAPQYYPLGKKKIGVGLFTEHVGSKRREGAENIVGGGERLYYLTYHLLSQIPELYVVPLAHGKFLSSEKAEKYFGFGYDSPPKPLAQYDLQFSISHLPRCAAPARKYAGLILFPSISPHDVAQFGNLYSISEYTKMFVRKWWGRYSTVMYPPTTYPCDDAMPVKKNIVLCVGRLVPFKRHLEVAQAFLEAGLRGWELHLVGTTGENPQYEAEVQAIARDHRQISVHTNISNDMLLQLYDSAKVLIGGMGLFASAPESFEHWGLTQVEGMSRGVVPVMYNGGGHREPYQRYLWRSTQELVASLRQLASSETERAKQSVLVRQMASKYAMGVYCKQVHRAIMESAFDTVDQSVVGDALESIPPSIGFMAQPKGSIMHLGKKKGKIPELRSKTMHFELENGTKDQWMPQDTQVVARWGNGKNGALIPSAPTRKVPLPTCLLPGEKTMVVMPVPSPPIQAGVLTLHIDVLRWRSTWINLGLGSKVRIV